MICPSCRKPVEEEIVYCDSCGSIVNNSSLDTYDRTMYMYKLIGILGAAIIIVYFIIEQLLW